MPGRTSKSSYLSHLERALASHLGWNLTPNLRAALESAVRTKAARLGFDPMIYAHRAATSEVELYTLADDVCQQLPRPTIHQPQFLFLGAVLLSKIAESALHKGPVRVWCASAPAGIEPFLPLIAIAELGLPPTGKHRVLLTEWRSSIRQAVSLGRFSKDEIAVLPGSLQEKYLTPTDYGTWQLSDQIRSRVQVDRGNALRASASGLGRGQFDLLIAPGALTLLTERARLEALTRFNSSLRRSAVLVVSESEAALVGHFGLLRIEGGPKGFFEKVVDEE